MDMATPISKRAGVVPGKGGGDKIPAKYTPGEFVVSKKMLAKAPGLLEMLKTLRAKSLPKGKTAAMANKDAIKTGTLKAEHGYYHQPKPNTSLFSNEAPAPVAAPVMAAPPAAPAQATNPSVSTQIPTVPQALPKAATQPGGLGMAQGPVRGFTLAQQPAAAPVAVQAPAAMTADELATRQIVEQQAQDDGTAPSSNPLAPIGSALSGQTARGGKTIEEYYGPKPAPPVVPQQASYSNEGRNNPAPGAAKLATPATPATPALPGAVTPPPAGPISSGQVTRDGNSYSGTNISGPVSFASPSGAPLAARGGPISAQNQAAAAGLDPRYAGQTVDGVIQPGLSGGNISFSGSQATPGVAAPAGPISGMPAGRTDAYGNSMAVTDQINAQLAASKAETDAAYAKQDKQLAGTIANAKTYEQGIDDRNAKHSADFTLSSSLSSKAQQAGASQVIQALNERRAAMERSAGETTRAGMQNATTQRGQDAQSATSKYNTDAQAKSAAARTDIERGQLGIAQAGEKRTAEAAQKINAAQDKYTNAKTPEERQVAAQNLLAMHGKSPETHKVVTAAGGQSVDANNNIIKTPDRVWIINEQTGQREEIGATAQKAAPKIASQAEFDKLPKGATYTGADGKTYRKP